MYLSISKWLYRFAKGKTILILMIGFICFIALTMALLPILLPDSVGIVSLDDPVFYNPQQIFSILQAWGGPVRIQELWFHLTWDVIVPVWSFLIVGSITSWLLARALGPQNKWRLLNLVACVTVFDLLENFSLAALILVYPRQLIWLAWLKTGFTMTKYGSGALILLVLLTGLLLSWRHKLRIQD